MQVTLLIMLVISGVAWPSTVGQSRIRVAFQREVLSVGATPPDTDGSGRQPR